MFKNRALHVSLVKTNDRNDPVAPNRPLIHTDDVAEIATIAAYWTKRTAIAGTAVYAIVKALDTSSEIAVIFANAKFNK